MSISPKDIWQSSDYRSVLGNKSSYPLRQIWVYVSHMANDYRNYWAFGKTTSSRNFFFQVIFIRFDLAVPNKSCTEEELDGDSFMGQAWKKCQTALQLVMVRSRTVNIQEILLEKLTAFMILILPKLLSRLEGKEKEDLQLQFGFRLLNLHKILFLIWPLKLYLKEMNVCNNINEKLDQKTKKPKSFLGKLSLLHESWDSHRSNHPLLLPVG